MKHLKYFRESANSDGFVTDEEEIRAKLKGMGVVFPSLDFDPIRVDPDGTVNIKSSDSVDLTVDLEPWLISSGVERLPVKFGFVSGAFFLCSRDHNPGKIKLTTLEGSPHTCREFEARGLKITNLVGGPKNVEWRYVCDSCDRLTSLQGGPQSSGEFYCSYTAIRDFTGLGNDIPVLWCDGTPSLISTKGIPMGVENFCVANCRNLTLPEDLEKLDKDNMKDQMSTTSEPDFSGTPIEVLIQSFIDIRDPLVRCRVSFYGEAFINFLYSLDYGYVKMIGGKPCVIQWKFEEALAELDMKLPNYYVGHKSYTKNPTLILNGSFEKIAYWLVDEKGRYRTSREWAEWQAFLGRAEKGGGRRPKKNYDRPPRSWRKS